jgi:hypothetical protein
VLSVSADKDFATFINDHRNDGRSNQSIAAALNRSRWSKVAGRRWSGRQVAGLCTSHASSDVDANLSAACTRNDCELHHRLSLLRAIRTWSPFDAACMQLISDCHQEGKSDDTIAVRLHHSGFQSPTGRRWNGQLVRILIHLQVAEQAAATDPAAEVDGFTPIAA